MKIPKTPFKAICIKEFNTRPQSDGKFIAWGCLELLRIYDFKIYEPDMCRFRIEVKVISKGSGYKVGLYFPGFNIITKKEFETKTVPYFFDHFIILKK